jgi:AbrB family looped-hinge helix DNA binding protein
MEKTTGDSKLTRKFQATIPAAVRKLLQLGSGDRLVFVLVHDHVLLKKGKLEIQD